MVLSELPAHPVWLELIAHLSGPLVADYSWCSLVYLGFYFVSVLVTHFYQLSEEINVIVSDYTETVTVSPKF